MKKALYSTTALAAAGMFALSGANALAQDKPQKMKIGVSGNYKFYAGYADQESSFETGANTHYGTLNVVSDSEVHFRGNTKLDNGVRIDVIIQVETDQEEANTAGNSIDESYVKLTGGFGDLRLGSTKDAIFVLKKQAAFTGIINTLNPDVQNFVAAPAGQRFQGNGVDNGPSDDMKIVYLTPKMAGFQAGFNYTPSTTDNDAPPITGGAASGTTPARSSSSAALAYDNKFGDVTVGASVGWAVNDGTGTNDNSLWHVGARIGFAGFTVGGAYAEGSDERDNVAATTTSSDRKAWNAGVLYRTGPWGVSATYATYERPERASVAGDDEGSHFNIGASYALGPGVTAGGNIFMVEFDDETTAAASNNEAWGVTAGINVAF